MTRRTSIVQQVGSYFASKGKVLTADEYKAADDVPIRFQLVKRGIGSWSRLLNMVGDISQYDGSATVATTPSAPAPSMDQPPEDITPEDETKPKTKPAVEKTKGA